MDPETLVDSWREDGQKLVQRLSQEEFPVLAAVWLKRTIDDRWRFYVVSPLGEPGERFKGYVQLHPLIREMPRPFRLGPFDVQLIGPSDPLAKDVLEALKTVRATPGEPVRWPGRWVGGWSVDDVYLYPPPTA